MATDREDLAAWVVRYERLWRTAGTAGLGELFTQDATYSTGPWSEPIRGLAAIAAFWDAGRVSPDEGFTLAWEIVAFSDDTGLVRVAADYDTGPRWRDLWIVELTDDGRCRAFEEWPFAPGQPTGQE